MVTLPLVPSSFVVCLHAHTLPDAQPSKVGKMEKSEPAVFRREFPNQRRYEDVRWHRVPAVGDAPEEPPKGRLRGAQKGGNRGNICYPKKWTR